MDNKITFGKYMGLTFGDLLKQDINYCTWLVSLKHQNQYNKELIHFLKNSGEYEKQLQKNLEEKVKKLNEQSSK